MPFASAEVFMVEIAHFYRHKFRLGELQVPAVSEVFTPLISARRGTACSRAFFLTISSRGGCEEGRKKDRTDTPPSMLCIVIVSLGLMLDDSDLAPPRRWESARGTR